MNLILDFPLGKDVIKIHIPQPSAERVKGCFEIFSYVFQNLKELPAVVLAKDLDIIIDRLSEKNPSLRVNFEALIQEAILELKPVTEHEGQSLLNGLELYNKLDSEDKELFRAIYVFQSALMRYASTQTIKESLSGYCTALTFEEFKESYLKSIKGMGVRSLERENQKA